MSKKICKKCDQEKPVEEFGKDSKQPDGIGAWCKQCAREYRDSRKNVSTGEKTGRTSCKIENKSNKPKTVKESKSEKTDSSVQIEKQERSIDMGSEESKKGKQKCKIDYLVSIQNHEIKGSFEIRTNYKPDKLMRSIRAVVTRQLQMIGIPDCEIIEIFKPQIVK